LAPEDPQLWARAMLRVFSDTQHAEELRRRGFARAATFSWNTAAVATREVYREALLA
jgi:glycosyltransferase involved in cell wall biosynthesis